VVAVEVEGGGRGSVVLRVLDCRVC
jgi:hypothetical protein